MTADSSLRFHAVWSETSLFSCMLRDGCLGMRHVYSNNEDTEDEMTDASRENLSSGFPDQFRHKPDCIVTEDG